MFLLSISLLLSSPHVAHQLCTNGKPAQCRDAEPAPGSNLAGEGFDITTLERKGAFVIDMNQWQREDKTCLLCSNPYMDKQLQKLPVSAVDWRAQRSCSAKVSSQLHRSSESLLTSSSSAVGTSWRIGLDVGVAKKGANMMLAGTHSKLADYSMGKTKSDKFSFTSQSMNCEYYSYRVSNTPKLHAEFTKEVQRLPKTYSAETKDGFYRLIETFGTHYITKVKLGGSIRSVTSIRQCQAQLQGISADEVQMCLEVEASASMSAATVQAQVKHCKKDTEKTDSKASFSSLFNDRFTEIKGGHTTDPDLLFSSAMNPSAFQEWMSTIPQSPDVISYSLVSLHELLPRDSRSHANLRSAISHYILEKALWRNCSEHCRAGVKSHSRDPCVCQCQNNPAVTSDCCPRQRGLAQVIITVQRATGLWGDTSSATDGFVMVFFNGKMLQRSRTINEDNNPRWNMVVDLPSQDLSVGQNVKFEVWDEDHSPYYDDKLGECERAVSPGVVEDVCAFQHGRLYFKLEMTCAPSLGGKSCETYKPSPMSPRLEKLYVSRHAHPVPKAMLAEMGVFVGRSGSQRNQSVTVDVV